MDSTEFMRNLIIETPSSPGNFAKVALVIGSLEGDMGDIQTIKIGTLSTIRDVAIHCRDEAHLQTIVDAINDIEEGIAVHAVTDDVLQAHEGGKIHMKSRMEIRSLGDLRRVYTPGVANVCEIIKKIQNKHIILLGFQIQLQSLQMVQQF